MAYSPPTRTADEREEGRDEDTAEREQRRTRPPSGEEDSPDEQADGDDEQHPRRGR